MTDYEYCNFCFSILSEKFENNNLYFQCAPCGNIVQSTPESTLRLEVSYSQAIYFSTAEEIVYDKTNTRVDIKCPCGGRIGSMRSYGDDCRVITMCENCMKPATLEYMN